MVVASGLTKAVASLPGPRLFLIFLVGRVRVTEALALAAASWC